MILETTSVCKSPLKSTLKYSGGDSDLVHLTLSDHDALACQAGLNILQAFVLAIASEPVLCKVFVQGGTIDMSTSPGWPSGRPSSWMREYLSGGQHRGSIAGAAGDSLAGSFPVVDVVSGRALFLRCILYLERR